MVSHEFSRELQRNARPLRLVNAHRVNLGTLEERRGAEAHQNPSRSVRAMVDGLRWRVSGPSPSVSSLSKFTDNS